MSVDPAPSADTPPQPVLNAPVESTAASASLSSSDPASAVNEGNGNAELSAPNEPVAPQKTKAQLYIEHRAQIENEFNEVKSIGIFYATLLVPLLVLIGLIHHRIITTQAYNYIFGAVFYGGIATFAWVWRKDLKGKFSWPSKVGWRIWLMVGLVPVVTLVLAYVSIVLAVKIGWPVRREVTVLRYAGYPKWEIYAHIAILPAWFEEIAFRGLLFTKLQRIMSPVQAMWVSAILFGIVHFTLFSLVIFLVPMALVAAWLTRRTGSLWPAMILHFLHNAGSIVFLS